MTTGQVKPHDTGIAKGEVERYVLPQLGALNFVLYDALGGGLTRALCLDAHENCPGFAILSMAIDLTTDLKTDESFLTGDTT